MAIPTCSALFALLLILSVSINDYVQAGTEVLRPRGVPLSKKAFYDPGKEFQCMDGSATIPFMLVNDDYCDCDDGSDEPGTSACPNGLFHCSNIGFVEKIIPSSRVNDGICDCCDGSDEYSGSSNCPNNCLQLGEQMRIERERYLELLKQGNEIRQRYIEEAKQRAEQTTKELEEFKVQLVEAEESKNAKLEVKTRAEELEKEALDKHRAEEDRIKKVREEENQKLREIEDAQQAVTYFKQLDINQDGVLTYEELKPNLKLDRDNDGVVSDDEAKYYLSAATEMGQDEFVQTSWHLMKRLLTDDRTNNEAEQLTDTSDTVSQNGEEIADEHPYEGEYSPNNEEEELEGTEEDEELKEPPQPTPIPDHSADSSFTLEYDEMTAQLVEEAKKAREEFSEVEGKFLDVQTKIREMEVFLETDYGQNGEYMTMRGQCFELHDNEYIYKLCPFDSASQRSKSGGTETSLGRWGKWIGPEHNRYERFVMEGGVQCWNGPVRSTVVYVSCGNENQLVRASEPNRCEYAFEFHTPAACVVSSGSSVPGSEPSSSNNGHEEL